MSDKSELRNLRLLAGLSIEELATELGISKSYLSLLETGKRALTPKLRDQFESRFATDLGDHHDGSIDVRLLLAHAQHEIESGRAASTLQSLEEVITASTLSGPVHWHALRIQATALAALECSSEAVDIWSRVARSKKANLTDRSESAMRACRLTFEVGDVRGAAALADENLAIATTEKWPAHHKVGLLCQAVGVHLHAGNPQRGTALMSEAKTIARQMGSPREIARAFWSEASVLQAAGSEEGAVAAMRSAIDWAETAEQLEAVPRMQAALAALLVSGDRTNVDQAEQLAQMSYQSLMATSNFAEASFALNTLVEVALQHEDFFKAAQLAEAGIASLDGQVGAAIELRMNLGRARFRSSGEALHLEDAANRILQETGRGHAQHKLAEFWAEAANAYATAGNAEAAIRCFREATNTSATAVVQK